jgi:hypothetical protein
MADNHRTNRLKTFWSPHQAQKQYPQFESAPVLPSPTIPFHGRQHSLSRPSEQLIPAKLVQINKDQPRNLAITRDGNALPLSPSFDSEEETAAGEPLVQDFATCSIPKEYMPFTAKDSDSHKMDLPMQRPPAMIFSDDDEHILPPTSRREAQFPPRLSRLDLQLTA